MVRHISSNSALLCTLLILYFTCIKASDPGFDKCSNLTIPGCSCVVLNPIFGITCNYNETDISSLPESLDSVFWVNTYEITLQHFPSVPSQVIKGLLVFRLIVDDPETVSVSESAFDGVIRLRWFHVYLSSISNIPNFTIVPPSLRQVNIDNSLLTKVQYEFQNLPFLTRLSLRNNTIESVHERAFNGTTAIQFLDLSHNRITVLPENIFDELKDIVKLTLSYNRLYTVNGLLKNIGSRLKFLNLEHNNLTNASEILSHTMPVLESVSLDNNPLRQLETITFADMVPYLRLISLAHCNLTDFKVEVFRPLTHLSLLDLSFNQIKHVGNDSLEFGRNFYLILNGNQLESFAAAITYRTMRLFATDNNLRELGTALQFTQLVEVDISRNRLIALKKENFYAASIENIAFRDNEIERVDVQCFNAFRNTIQTLDLSSNRLTSLNRSVQFLSQLKILNVSFNLIETLDDDEFIGLNELSDLYMQNNRIVVIRGQIQLIPNLQYLILRNNTIEQLDLNQIPSTLKYLYIKGNPLNCNCQLYMNFLRKLRETPEMDFLPCEPDNTLEHYSQPCKSPCSCNCENNTGISSEKDADQIRCYKNSERLRQLLTNTECLTDEMLQQQIICQVINSSSVTDFKLNRFVIYNITLFSVFCRFLSHDFIL